MAKPRIFVSSTYYDLKYIRDGIEAFITSIGYEAILFEKGGIAFHPDKALEDSCYQEVEGADMLILIVGGRYGSLSREDEEKVTANPEEYIGRIRSITNKEYESARARDIPTFIFIDQNVFAEHRTYLENKVNKTIRYAHVDNASIYEMVDDIILQKKANFIKPFSNLEDITQWLRDQWAGIFADLLKRRSSNEKIRNIETQISDLTAVVSALKSYSETIIKQIDKPGSAKIIRATNKNLNDAREKKLRQENMIEYIVATHKEISGGQLLHSLITNTNIKDFLVGIGLSGDAADAFVKEHNGVAIREFERLKEAYGAGDGVNSSEA
jgi:hypothetical protein